MFDHVVMGYRSPADRPAVHADHAILEALMTLAAIAAVTRA